MSGQLLEKLGRLNDVRRHEGASTALITAVERDHGFALPGEHSSVLRWSNGVEAYAGYVRLFGLQTTESIDAVAWNAPDCWKFAWGTRCAGYWCFGETAWGDQFAYSLDALRTCGDTTVFFLDALSMTPSILAASFAEFMEKEYVRSAEAPYDVMLARARGKFGPLEARSHLVYVPSVLLVGTENIDNVQKMNARAAMICNGDIATQLDAGPPDSTVKAVRTYTDELHRTRLRLVWT